MHYRNLVTISGAYGSEINIIRTSDDMKGYFTRLENKLKAAMAQLAVLDRGFDKPKQVFGIQRESVGGKIDIKSMTQKFQQAALVAPTVTPEQLKEIGRLRAEVANLRKWLLMEGLRSDEDGNIIWPADGQWRVVYDNDPAVQAMHKIRFDNKKAYMRDGDKEVLLDTSDMVTHFSGPGYGIYVMTGSGELYVSSHIVGKWHHSSLLGAARVAGAGELRAKDGVVTFLSNKSGHYIPMLKHFFQVVRQIEKKSDATLNCPVLVYTELFLPPSTVPTSGSPKARDERFPSVLALEQALQSKNVERKTYDYEYNKLATYSAYLSNAFFSANGKANWRMNTGGEAWGVNTQAGVVVPPREVRRWLRIDMGKTSPIELRFTP